MVAITRDSVLKRNEEIQAAPAGEVDNYKWEPHETYRDETIILDIPGPPCKHCAFWKPQRQYMTLPKKVLYDGVTICRAEDMYNDFSCFEFRVSGDGPND